MSKYEYDSDKYILENNHAYIKQCYRQKNFIDENIFSQNYSSILEIGASSGFNLSIYNGKMKYGIEPSAINCQLARKNYNINMFNGMWSEYIKINHEKFDIIFLSMTLEHIVNPYKFILECKNFLNADKYIFIEVPTLDYKFLDEPFGMFCEEHVNIFTLQSLTNLMTSAGFSLINCEMIFNLESKLPAAYPSIMTLWQLDNNTRFKRELINSEAILDKYISKNENLLSEINASILNIPNYDKLALYGAGHYVSMLLANTCLINKNIVCVYDADSRKEGFYIAGHEIRPFTLEDSERKKLDGIIITSYTAQNEIYKFLLESGFKGKIYTLHE